MDGPIQLFSYVLTTCKNKKKKKSLKTFIVFGSFLWWKKNHSAVFGFVYSLFYILHTIIMLTKSYLKWFSFLLLTFFFNWRSWWWRLYNYMLKDKYKILNNVSINCDFCFTVLYIIYFFFSFVFIVSLL
jgi:hypothetical protein